ncbi:MAG: Yip1 family protein [Pyrinomonadaceae bacterium]
MENQENAEPQVPTPRVKAESEPPQMSEAATLGNIFFEPGRTFEDLKRKPRFVMAAIIISLLVTAYGFGLYYKVGDAGIRSFAAEQMDKSSQTASMTSEQKANAIDLNMTISKVVRFVLPIFVMISLLIGGLLYWGGAKAFGGSGGFLHAVSVWVYASLPPTVVGMIANFIVLAFKSVDDIDLAVSQRGVIQANLSFLVNGKTAPVLATLLSTLDLFAIWGWVLAAIGLRLTNRLSAGSAWAVVLILALIGIAARVVIALFTGNPS